MKTEEEIHEDLIGQLQDAIDTDEEQWTKKGEYLMNTYEKASDGDKALINDIFITICGWSLDTLIARAKGNSEEEEDE